MKNFLLNRSIASLFIGVFVIMSLMIWGVTYITLDPLGLRYFGLFPSVVWIVSLILAIWYAVKPIRNKEERAVVYSQHSIAWPIVGILSAPIFFVFYIITLLPACGMGMWSVTKTFMMLRESPRHFRRATLIRVSFGIVLTVFAVVALNPSIIRLSPPLFGDVNDWWGGPVWIQLQKPYEILWERRMSEFRSQPIELPPFPPPSTEE